MKEAESQLGKLLKKMEKTAEILDLAKMRAEAKVLGKEMERSDFWKDRERAQKISKELNDLNSEISKWDSLEAEIQESLDLADLYEKEGKLEEKYQHLLERFGELEFKVLLGKKYDKNNAIVAIHAGTGGTDAQDWAEMLKRMLLRYCEKKGFRAKIVDESRGGEAGIKSATFEVEGFYAYGYLKSEAGVHRLVRISPFDAEKMRHTSFALVEVLPELGEVEQIKLKDEDLKIDVFRAGGHGGQSVNTTDSAVRVVHKPTGITVVCQNERSQHQNKETAFRILKSKLYKLYLDEQQQEKQKVRGEYTSAEWGNQIRSYVLQPYKMVKDHRTEYQEPDPEAVLDGKLDGFVEAFLRDRKFNLT